MISSPNTSFAAKVDNLIEKSNTFFANNVENLLEASGEYFGEEEKKVLILKMFIKFTNSKTLNF